METQVYILKYPKSSTVRLALKKGALLRYLIPYFTIFTEIESLFNIHTMIFTPNRSYCRTGI